MVNFSARITRIKWLIFAIALLLGFGATEDNANAIQFGLTPPRIQFKSLIDDPALNAEINNIRLKQIVDDYNAGRKSVAKRKLNLFITAFPTNVQALEIIGTIFMNEGRQKPAVEYFRKALLLAPQQVSLHTQLGIALLNLENLREGGKHLQYAMENAPDDILVLANYGWLLARLGEFRRAAKIYQRLMKKDNVGLADRVQVATSLADLYQRTKAHAKTIDLLAPLLVGAKTRHPRHRVFLNLFAAYIDTNDMDNAKRVLARLEAILPENDAGLPIARARYAAKTGDMDAAYAFLDKALTNYPSEKTGVYVERARLKLNEGRFDEAKSAYFLAAENAGDGDRLAILTEFTTSFETAGRAAAAILVLKKFAEAHPGQYDIPLLLAETNARIGNQDNALSLLDNIVAAQPRLARAHFLRGMLLHRKNRTSEARDAVRRSLSIEPQNPQAWHVLANLTQILEGEAAMAKVFGNALANNPTDPGLLTANAMIQYGLGNLDASEALFRQILARNRDSAMALASIALILIDRRQEMKEAEKFISRAIRIAPNVPAIADTWGWMLYRTGRTTDAVRMLNKIAKAIPKDGGVQYHLAIAYVETGRGAMGRIALEKALELGLPKHYEDDARARLKLLR